MLYIVETNAEAFLEKFRELIDDGTITTWKYDGSGARFYWTANHDGNWTNLTQKVYFRAEGDPNNICVRISLCVPQTIHLDVEEYATMHKELLYTIMAHKMVEYDRIQINANLKDLADIIY